VAFRNKRESRVTDSLGSVSNVNVVSTSRNPERIVSAAIYYVSVHIVVRKVTARRQMILDVSEVLYGIGKSGELVIPVPIAARWAR